MIPGLLKPGDGPPVLGDVLEVFKSSFPSCIGVSGVAGWRNWCWLCGAPDAAVDGVPAGVGAPGVVIAGVVVGSVDSAGAGSVCWLPVPSPPPEAPSCWTIIGAPESLVINCYVLKVPCVIKTVVMFHCMMVS